MRSDQMLFKNRCVSYSTCGSTVLQWFVPVRRRVVFGGRLRPCVLQEAIALSVGATELEAICLVEVSLPPSVVTMNCHMVTRQRWIKCTRRPAGSDWLRVHCRTASPEAYHILHTHTPTPTLTHAHTRARAHICMRIFVYIRIYTNICVKTYTYT